MALITRLSQSFVGSDLGNLPVIRPGFGVGGTVHRFRASDLTAVDGTALTSITSQLSALTLTGNATLKVENGRKFFRFDGVDDLMYSGILPSTQLRTIAMIVRMNGTPSPVASFGAGNVSISSGGTVVGSFTGASAWNNAGNDRTKWRLLTVRVGGSTGQYHGVSNNATLSGDIAGATTDATFLRLGASASSGAFGAVDIADIATWGTVLSDADIATLYAGAKLLEPTLS